MLASRVDFKPGSFRSNSPGRSDLSLTDAAGSMAVSGTCDAHFGEPRWAMESTQRVAWPCVVDVTFRFPERSPARPETWVPAAGDNHAERCDRPASSVVLVPSGPAVPLPQGANKWRSSPEGGLR